MLAVGAMWVFAQEGEPQHGTSPLTAPAPSSVSVTTDQSSADISWSEVPGAVKYWASWSGGSKKTSNLSTTATGLTCDRNYTFRVKARGDDDEVYNGQWGPSRAAYARTKDCGSPTHTPTPTRFTPTPTPVTPTPTPTRRPTATPAPEPTRPPMIEELTSTPFGAVDEGGIFVDGDWEPNWDTGQLFLDWEDVTGANYKVQISDRRVPGIGVYTWKTLPHDRFTLNGTKGGGDLLVANSEAVVGGLKFSHPYDFRIVNVKDNQESEEPPSKEFSLPLPFLGHQADHTVQYVLGTPAPTRHDHDPREYDPQAVIPTAIAHGINDWNSSSVALGEPGVLICHREQSPHDESRCGNRLDDGRTVTVNVLGPDGCGPASACIRQKYWQVADTNGHVRDLELILEEPARYYIPGQPNISRPQDSKPSIRVRLYWTNNSQLHLHDVPVPIENDEGGYKEDSQVYVYIPRTIMHELGHTLGLHDLYRFGSDYHLYLMGSDSRGYPHVQIPPNDLNYLGEVYRHHSVH